MQFLLVNGRLFQLVANVIRYTETNVYVAIFQCQHFFFTKNQTVKLNATCADHVVNTTEDLLFMVYFRIMEEDFGYAVPCRSFFCWL